MPRCPRGTVRSSRSSACLKKCRSNQHRSRVTNRCRKSRAESKIVSRRRTSHTRRRRCPRSKVRSRVSGRCVKRCKYNQRRDQETGRCVNDSDSDSDEPWYSPRRRWGEHTSSRRRKSRSGLALRRRNERLLRQMMLYHGIPRVDINSDFMERFRLHQLSDFL